MIKITKIHKNHHKLFVSLIGISIMVIGIVFGLFITRKLSFNFEILYLEIINLALLMSGVVLLLINGMFLIEIRDFLQNGAICQNKNAAKKRKTPKKKR